MEGTLAGTDPGVRIARPELNGSPQANRDVCWPGRQRATCCSYAGASAFTSPRPGSLQRKCSARSVTSRPSRPPQQDDVGKVGHRRV